MVRAGSILAAFACVGVVALVFAVADTDSRDSSSLPSALNEPSTTAPVALIGAVSPPVRNQALAQADRWPIGMDFVDDTSAIGWSVACEEGGTPCATAFVASDDGGLTWERRGTIDAWGFEGSFWRHRRTVFVSASVGWFLAGGNVWATSDGARTWQGLPAPGVTTLAAGGLANDAWAIGSCGPDDGPCLHAGTLHAGSAEITPSLIPRANDGAVRAFGDGPAITVVVETVNEGPVVFDTISPCRDFKGLQPLIVALDRTQAWLTCLGEPGGGQGPQEIHRSTDGGRVWSLVADNACCGYPEPPVGTLSATQLLTIAPSPGGVLLGSGKYGSIHRSVDGGASWNLASDMSTGAGMRIDWVSAQTAFAWTNADLQVTRDAGATWEMLRRDGQ